MPCRSLGSFLRRGNCFRIYLWVLYFIRGIVCTIGHYFRVGITTDNNPVSTR